jgi:hypothetical protein
MLQKLRMPQTRDGKGEGLVLSAANLCNARDALLSAFLYSQQHADNADFKNLI